MDFLQHNWLLILVFIASGGMLLWPIVQKNLSGMRQLSPQQATMLMNRNKPVLLDVREDKELDGGKLPNALHIPLSQLGTRGQELASLTGRPVLVYCARGQRAAQAARPLAKLGFKEIYGLAGGVRAWVDAHLPLEK